jgi:predicted nucleotidyltransferase component of viral defense system
MIKEWLATYEPKTAKATEQALREIMQEIALAGLHRAGFFKEAAFYGGTALRIFYGLDRFSEDLDFSLMAPDAQFSLEQYLAPIEETFAALGMKVSVKEKIKSKESNVDSAFLKSDTIWNELTLENTYNQIELTKKPSIKIKIEVDTLPPIGFETEEKILLKPYSFYVNCFTPSNLFAGKMHALLFRKWKNRIKGRDWYDLEWYVKKSIPINLKHLCVRANDSGDWNKLEMTKPDLMKLLQEKIETINIALVKEDVIPFIQNQQVLDIWSAQYFMDLVQHIKVL